MTASYQDILLAGHLYFGENMSIREKVLSVLKSGKPFTAGQMAGLFKTTESTVAARISDLRAEGYSIYSNKAKNGKTAYRLGRPSRAMVAAAFAVAGSSVFQ